MQRERGILQHSSGRDLPQGVDGGGDGGLEEVVAYRRSSRRRSSVRDAYRAEGAHAFIALLARSQTYAVTCKPVLSSVFISPFRRKKDV